MSKKSKRRRKNHRKRKEQQLLAAGKLFTTSSSSHTASSTHEEATDGREACPKLQVKDLQKRTPTLNTEVGLSSTHTAMESSTEHSPNDHQPKSLEDSFFFGSRKRKLEPVAFVYPKKKAVGDGSSLLPEPYIFTKQKPASSPRLAPVNGEKNTMRDRGLVKESLTELFATLKKKKAKQSIGDNEGYHNEVDETTAPATAATAKPDGSVSQQDPAQPRRRARGLSIDETGQPVGGHFSGKSIEEIIKDRGGLRPRANSTDFELKLPRRGLCDERHVHQFYKWDPEAKTQKSQKKSPKGLNNLGNTCFLNSTIQCLAHIPPFCQSIIEMPSTPRISINGHTGKVPQGKRITLILKRLFEQMHDVSHDHAQGLPAISPTKLVNTVPSLGNIGSRNGYKFHPGRQEDAHEFLVHLLDAMHDGELREAGINPNASGWRDRLPVPRLDETTLIHRIFGGYFRSQVQCTKCGYCSNTYDPFLDLSLEVSKGSCTTVYDAVQEFTRKEQLDSENRWKCSGCQKRVRATKQLSVFRPPLSLCMQLKRFTYSNHSSLGLSAYNYSGNGKKISKPVDFPRQLNLPLSDGRACSYELVGIVIHFGGSASSGHYTACVRKQNRHGSHQWFAMDDSSAEPISEKAVLRNRDAYLLFYTRSEVKIEYPTPPIKDPALSSSLIKVEGGDTNKISPLFQQKQSAPNTSGEKAQFPGNPARGQEESDSTSHSSSSTSSSSQSSLASSLTPKTNSATIENGDVHKHFSSSSSSPSSSSSSSSPAPNIDSSTPKIPEKAPMKISVDRGYGQGRVEVMARPRNSNRAWVPPLFSKKTSEGFELLGTQKTSKWDDDEGDIPIARNREKIVEEIEKGKKATNGRVYLDRWDAMLDAGKVGVRC